MLEWLKSALELKVVISETLAFNRGPDFSLKIQKACWRHHHPLSKISCSWRQSCCGPHHPTLKCSLSFLLTFDWHSCWVHHRQPLEWHFSFHPWTLFCSYSCSSGFCFNEGMDWWALTTCHLRMMILMRSLNWRHLADILHQSFGTIFSTDRSPTLQHNGLSPESS